MIESYFDKITGEMPIVRDHAKIKNRKIGDGSSVPDVPFSGRPMMYNEAGKKRKEVSFMAVTDFRGEYGFLSNFYKSPVTFEGLTYPCVENAFQAGKCADREGKVKYTSQNNPVKAKMMGKKEKLPDNWETLSVELMEKLIRTKFSDPELAAKLVATGDEEITEGNRWHDNKWGKCFCERCQTKPAQNKLGMILMKTREDIKLKSAK